MLLVCSGGQHNGKRNSIWYTLLLMLCLIFSNQWNSINRRSISNKYSNTCKTRVIKIICQWCTDNGKRNSEWYTLLLMLCVIFSNKHSINRRSTSNKLNSCRSHMLICQWWSWRYTESLLIDHICSIVLATEMLTLREICI